MFIKKKYEASNPFKITDVKCDQKWLAEAGNDGLVVSCLINGVPCKFPFKGARWSKVMVGGLGIDCEDALFPRSGSFWPEHVKIASEGGGNYYAPLRINDDVATSQPKENQKDFRFTGQLYSTAPIAKAFKTKLLELYNKGYLTQKFLEHVGAAEAPTEEVRRHSANEARMLKGNNYSYNRDFAGKSGSIGDLRLYDDGKMTFTSYNSKKYPSATWKFKDLDTARTFYSAIDFMLLDLSYGNVSDEEFAEYLSRKYPNLRVEAVNVKEDLILTYKLHTIIYKDLFETDGSEINTFYNLNQSEAPHFVEETKGQFGAPSAELEGKATEYLRDAIENKHAVKVKWIALSNWGNDFYESWSYDLVSGLRCPDHIKKKLPPV